MSASTPTRGAATLIGFGAVLLWASLALLTVYAAPTPPFLLNAVSFLIGGLIGLGYVAARARREGPQVWRAALFQPARVWALGVLGLFGYHFFYFTALRNAPPAEAGLIAYLWPLLIVLFSAFLPGERLRSGHVIGGLLGLAGAVTLLFGKEGVALTGSGGWIGYGSAALCALLWSSYSVLSRRIGDAPTTSVAGFCLVAALLSALCHFAFEDTVWPSGALGWIGVVGLGLGPVGLAFYVWDVGCKHGDIQLLGVLSYAAPLLSTILLVVATDAEATGPLFIGLGLIVAGSLWAARASFAKPSLAAENPS